VPSILVRVADAVAELLTSASSRLDLEYVAQRTYPPKDLNLGELTGLRVDVIPVAHAESKTIDRSRRTQYLCEVDIGIRKKFRKEERDSTSGEIHLDEVDRLVEFVEQIHDFLTDPDGQRRLPGAQLDATWEDTKIRATYVQRHLREWQQFTGIVRVSYRAFK
jgi:hypothetical protein